MKKWIIISIFVLIIAAYTSSREVDYLNNPSTCTNCHGNKHQDNSLADMHLNKSIECIECHSGSGTKGYVDARKELIDIILLNRSGNILNIIFYNYPNTSNLTHLKANCTKCHLSINSKYFNHTNKTNCTACHVINGSYELPETGLLEKMNAGGHRNKTCEDCHSNNFRIPECVSCHTPHKENSGWNNSICLDCHNNPHIPILNGTYATTIGKDKCGACHEKVSQTLAFYNSKHNQLDSCVYCHPVHREKKKCFYCHVQDHNSHPFAENNCNACHTKAQCNDCHIDPHAPLRGLPQITAKDQFNDYASKKNH